MLDENFKIKGDYFVQDKVKGTTFKPFDRVIYCDGIRRTKWICGIFSHFNSFPVINGVELRKGVALGIMLPFDGNEELVGTDFLPLELSKYIPSPKNSKSFSGTYIGKDNKPHKAVGYISTDITVFDPYCTYKLSDREEYFHTLNPLDIEEPKGFTLNYQTINFI